METGPLFTIKMNIQAEVNGEPDLPKMSRKRKRIMKPPNLDPKNPIQLLNEVKPSLQYTLIGTEGPVHACRYTYEVQVLGETYKGVGASKKEAKSQAANLALRSCISKKSNEIWEKLARRVSNTPPEEPFTAHVEEALVLKLIDEQDGNSNKNSDSTLLIKSKRVKLEPKSPILLLNELKSNIEFKLKSAEGPVHSCVYTMEVMVNGIPYTGEGKSKKEARMEAAANALKSQIANHSSDIFQKLARLVTCTPSGDIPNVDDEQLIGLIQTEPVKEESNGKAETAVGTQKQRPEKTPSQVLNELIGSTAVYKMVKDDGPPHAREFTVEVDVRGQTYKGVGNSKKSAKSEAARKALAGAFNITDLSAFSLPGHGRLPPPPLIPPHLRAPPSLADHIGRLVNKKYEELLKDEDTYQRRKVLAGIVMTTGVHMEDAKIISVTTGTKCISGEHMSTEGKSLNDSHAEVLARRCLVDYLLTEIDRAVSEGLTNSIFDLTSDKKQLRIKDFVKFHLFISSAPCGDARIFSPHEMPNGEERLDRHPNRSSRGQLRTKIESGEGTIPVKSNYATQTWDGIMSGQRLLTMSCSDKVARWNVLGLQGAVLSLILEPVYIETVILGSLFHPGHLYRAVCGRMTQTLQGLPPPFKLNRPCMNMISSPEPRQPGKSPTYALNWISDSKEIINTNTGKTESGCPSRLCRQALFSKFMRLVEKLQPLLGISSKLMSTNYADVKALASDYQAAKNELVSAFQKADCGTWITKPMEQDQFTLNPSIFSNR